MTTTRIKIGSVRWLGSLRVEVLSAERDEAGERHYVIRYLDGASAGHQETRTRASVLRMPLVGR